MKTRKSNSTTKISLELKYCELCGGLRLRPVGGNEIYCARCSSQMGEMNGDYYGEKTTQIAGETEAVESANDFDRCRGDEKAKEGRI